VSPGGGLGPWLAKLLWSSCLGIAKAGVESGSPNWPSLGPGGAKPWRVSLVVKAQTGGKSKESNVFGGESPSVSNHRWGKNPRFA
jgi:hypothetical protein